MIESRAIQHYNSNAKINLGLNVLNKRKDGYHNLHSLFVEIELTDELLFTPSEVYQLTAEGDQANDLPLDENNLIIISMFAIHLVCSSSKYGFFSRTASSLICCSSK